jgi:hypothetical protein
VLVSDRLPNIPLVSRVLEVCVRELGIVHVAKALGVTPVQIDRWQTGCAPMPKESFLKLVDVLVAATPQYNG